MLDWVWIISPWTWFSLAVGFGLLLMLWGWVGRRFGNEPRCRRCTYQLEELPSAICPECGLDSARRRPRRGLRRVRYVPLFGGLLIVCGALAPVGWTLRDANWRTKAPLWVLQAAIDFGDRKACDELSARIMLGGVLSETETRAVATRALDVQRDAPLDSARLAHWLRILGQLDRQNLLTDGEWERLMRQCVRRVDAQVRPRCRTDRPLPIALELVTCLPPEAYVSCEVRICSKADGQIFVERQPISPFDARNGSIAGGRGGSQAYSSLLSNSGAVGQHDVELEVFLTMNFFAQRISAHPGFNPRGLRPSLRRKLEETQAALSARGNSVEGEEARRLWSDLRTLEKPDPLATITQRFDRTPQIIPAGSDADLEILRGPAIRKTLDAALSVELIDVQTGVQAEGVVHFHKEPTIRLQSALPWPAAFDVEVITDEDPIALGNIRAQRGNPQLDRKLRAIDWRSLRGRSVRLLLRPDVEAARKSIDLTFVDEQIERGPILIADQ